MPKIEIYKDDLEKLTRRKFTLQELEDVILFVKGEVESIEKSKIKIDIKDTNRPDLWSVEGIARELRGHFQIEEGLQRYKVMKSGIILNVDRKVGGVRPKIVAAVVRNLKFDDRSIEQIIQLQEKVSMNYGRKRKEIAIGIYDFDKIKSPIKYTTFKDYEIKFTPLDFETEMSPKEILKNHPKGKEFGHLIGDDFPILIDSKKDVLSMPPIINSALTGKITGKTKNVFIEATGYDLRLLSTALNVIVTALAERKGRIESVSINYGKKKFIFPNLKEREFRINPESCRRFLGLEISDKEILQLLRQSRYDAKQIGRNILCQYPAYRDDIMHERDVIEDVAIAYGYNNMEPEIPSIVKIGSSNELEDFCDLLRDLMIGLGFQEVLTFILTNKGNIFGKMNIREMNCCEIANPVSSSFTAMRNWLLPSSLEFLTKNLHVDYPHKIFEVGDVVIIDEKQETKTKTMKKLACVITDTKVGYEDISSCIDALMRNLGIAYKIKPIENPSFISGRVGEIFVDNNFIGIIGELNPGVLNNWGLEKPCIAFELNVDEIFRIL